MLPREAEAQDDPERGLLREVFANIPGQNVADLTSHPSFPDDPTSTNIESDFDAPVEVMDNYGQRMHGYLIPPQTGEYTFWISSDDASQLFLSSDTDPANAQQIASVATWTPARTWDKEPNQESDPIELVADEAYYVSALMKEGPGGDHLTVRWELPDGTMEEPIPGSRLLPFGVSFEAPEIARQPEDATVTEGEPVSFAVELETIGPKQFQWYQDGEPISDATSRVLTIERVALEDDGAELHVEVTNREGSVSSDTATLRVNPDNTPPELLEARNLGEEQIEVTFSEPVDPETASNSDNYSLDPALAILSGSVGANERVVILETDPVELGTGYTLTVSEIRDQAATPNVIAENSSVSFTAASLTPEPIGEPDTEGSIETLTDGFNITGSGESIEGNNDQFHFSYRQRTGDFDVQARVAGIANTDPWAKAGLMARQTLETDSPYAGVFATPSIGGTHFLARERARQTPSPSGSFPVNYPYTWIRLERTGDTLTGYAGYDGKQWQQLGSVSTDLPDRLYLGLAVVSGSSETATTANFRDFTDSQDPTPMGERPDVEPLGPSSRTTGLVISEIHYRPAEEADTETSAFIELFNSRPIPRDLSGFRLTGSIEYAFPDGTTLDGGEFLVVAASPDATRLADSPADGRILGPYEGELPRDEGTIELRNRIDARLLEIEYRNRAPWPIEPDGTGHSLVLKRPSYGEANHQAWGPSQFKGGSPGQIDPVVREPIDRVRINEMLTHPTAPAVDFIELYNHSNQEVNLSGAFLSDQPDENRFQIPDGTTISPGGYLVFDEPELGFALDPDGEQVYLIHPDSGRVMDAVRFQAHAADTAYGRFPDGAAGFQELAEPTAGGPNAPLLTRNIVINELMYHPPSREVNDEYLELHNLRDETVDLSGWRIADGIRFTFPDGTTIASNGYLVVAKDAERLIGRYEALNPDNTVGDFGGRLSNGGERIALELPQGIIVDEVEYRDGGRWGEWADGDGSSLELIDPRSDNRRADNWADSDETGKSEWVTVEHTGVLDHGRGSADELHKLLLGAGECLVDNVEVRVEDGPNRISNPAFERGIGGWLRQGQMINSSWFAAEGFESGSSYLLRASGGGDNGANRVETDLTQPLQPGQIVTIRADARWRRGHPDLLLRLKGNYLEALGSLPIPENLGTPGAHNSQAVDNAGPAIFDVAHYPVLPRNNEPVIVTARLHDPDGIDSATLNYRIDPGASQQSLPLNDNGTDGDRIAGDGIHSATIPGQASDTLVAFHIEASDAHGDSPTTTLFPDDATRREALVRFGETIPPGNFGTYRFWFTEETVNEWSQRVELSNHDLDGTFVYGDFRAIYNIGARWRGSPWVRPGYSNPVDGGLTAYKVSFPKDDELMGSRGLNLDTLEPGRDRTHQRERMSFWIGDRLDVPFSHQRYVYLFTNGNRRGEVYADSKEPDDDYIEAWYPEADEGELFKIDDWFEFNDDVQKEFNVDATLERFTTTGGRYKKARYRWNWEKRSADGLNDDYSSLFRLVDAVNTSGPGYTDAVESVVDLEQWMRVFAARHIVADWDGYGYNRGKNMFTYRPVDGSGWKMFLWDLDFSLGGGSSGPTANLFSANDSVVRRIYNHPPFRRAYLRAMHDAVEGPLRPEAMHPVLDANYQAFQRNDVNVQSPDPIKSWVSQRRDYIQSVLNQVESDFEVTNIIEPTSNENLVRIEGTAPVGIRTLEVNGIAYPVTWNDVTQWEIRYALQSGENELTITGRDSQGEMVEGASETITLNFDGELEPAAEHLVINELMYHSQIPEAEYVELVNTAEQTTFDLAGYSFDGIDFTFPEGRLIEPGSFVVIPRNAAVFAETYGALENGVNEFAGRLDNAGETIRLLAPEASPEENRQIVDVVTYDRRPPWPSDPDGQGPSLQLIDARRDNQRVGNWASAEVRSETPEPQTLIELDQTWRFDQSGTDLGTEWREPAFDDSNWQEGQGLLYVEDAPLPGPKSTPLDLGETTYYFRTELENPIEDPSGVVLELTTVLDDGAVIYLNGEEIIRIGMPPGTISHSTFAARTVSDAGLEGAFELPADALQPGANVLAVEVHQTNSGSSDIVWGARMETRHETVGPFTPGEANSVAQSLPPFPEVRINEIQTQNESTIATEAGEAAPWLELYNGGDSLDLTDFALSDDPEALSSSPFPEDASLGSEDFRMVWLDGQPGSQEEWHTTFAVGSDPGILLLTRDVGTREIVVDYRRYDTISADQSFGLFPDGRASATYHFISPTPGERNTLETPAVEVYINEWLALNEGELADPADGQFDDWFELYNAGDETVDLTGYTLTDDLENPAQVTIPPGTGVPSNGFLLVWADNDPGQTEAGEALHVDFRLSASGEAIGLFAPDGSAIDTVTFGEQTADISEGRFPDGAPAPFVMMENPTPGAPNRQDGQQPPPDIRPGSVAVGPDGTVSFSWEAADGTTFVIESKDRLSDPEWEPLGEVTASDSTASFTDPESANSLQSRFYRIRRVD